MAPPLSIDSAADLQAAHSAIRSGDREPILIGVFLLNLAMTLYLLPSDTSLAPKGY